MKPEDCPKKDEFKLEFMINGAPKAGNSFKVDVGKDPKIEGTIVVLRKDGTVKHFEKIVTSKRTEAEKALS